MTIAIILPAFNEEQTVASTINEFHMALPKASIWVINNGSTDKTLQIAKATLKSKKILGGILDEPLKGKGNAIRKAFLEIDASVYIISDADSTYSADDINKFLSPIKNNEADIVVGNRHAGNAYKKTNYRPFHSIGNRFVCFLVNQLFNAKLHDIMSGFRVMSKKFVKNYPILVGGFEIETDMTLYALDRRFRILEFPIQYRDRPKGSFSKLNTFQDGARVILTIIKILKNYRPFMFFGIFALVFFIGGILIAIPVLRDWYLYKYIYHLPLAILATGIELLSLLMLSIALILDSIVTQDKRNFEYNYLRQTAENIKK